MSGQAEIIIRGEVDDLLAVESADRRLLVVEHAQAEVRAFGLEIVQLVGEVRKRIGSSGSGCHGIAPIPDCREISDRDLHSVPAQFGRTGLQFMILSSQRRESCARDFSSDTSRSGLPAAALAAPAPGRGDGRFTHTVAMPSDCAGITS